MFLLLLVVLPTMVGAMEYLPMPHGEIGLSVAWQKSGSHDRSLVVTAVTRGLPADRAGVRVGDTIVGFPTFSDRITVVGEGTLYSMAPGQRVAFTLQHSRRVTPLTLQAVGRPLTRTIFLAEFRLALYLLGTCIVGALVFLRPSKITWGFALFVIFATQPTLEITEFIGSLRWPPGFLAAWFLTDAVYYVGLQGLLAFAIAFPDNAPPKSHRILERIVLAFNGLLIIALIGGFVNAFFGIPAWSIWSLPDLATVIIYNVPAIVAITVLAIKLTSAKGDARIPLIWALGGPLVSMILFVADMYWSALPFLGTSTPILLGMLSSIAPFSMMYAILRHRVIDIGFTLNTTFAEAVSQTKGATEPIAARRQIVRRTALLLSADLPLQTLYSQFALLLASFVDASTVLLAVKSAKGSHFEFIFEDGVSGKPDDTTVNPNGNTGSVLRD